MALHAACQETGASGEDWEQTFKKLIEVSILICVSKIFPVLIHPTFEIVIFH
jgi:hypothetical protein